LIQINNLSKSYGLQELFSNLSFKLNAGNKIGLVGRNGSGKSTLFKLLMGIEEADSGDISIPKGYKIGSLEQHLVFTEETLEAEASLALEYDYEFYKVEKILFGLGFTTEDLAKNPLDFSGGYQIRINLAKLLVTEPNLLLLDEPTNYLDIVSLRWLKTFLKEFEGEVLIITHDRDFMDSFTTHTMGIVRRTLFAIPGNTYKYYTRLAENDELFAKEKVNQDKKRKELEEFVARNKARASTASLAQSKQKQLDKMEDMGTREVEKSISFNFNFKHTTAKNTLAASDVSFGYDPENLLFKDINFVLEKGKTIAIIGKNGKGKSTLLNTLAGELTAVSGTLESHESIKFAHFGQTNISRLDPKNTILSEISGIGVSEQLARNLAGGMMFSGDLVDKKVGVLSGGEKSRVMLAQILAKPANLLFLDEPTNHLDMFSITSLTKAIKEFEGSTLIVTHSEEMLRSVADALIIFHKGGAEYFDGNYDEFLEKVGWEEEEGIVKKKSKPKLNKKERKKLRAPIIAEKSKIASPIKKEIDLLEQSIVKMQSELDEFNNDLDLASHKMDHPRVTELSEQVRKIEKQMTHDMEVIDKREKELDVINEEYEKKLDALDS
jgi:ATP-binding cassette, subfamily F, member 3